MRGKLWGILVVGLAGLTACTTTSEPVRKFTKGDELAYYEFSSPGTFEEGTYGDNVARLQVREGVYHVTVAEGDSELWWGQWGDTYDNVVIDVDTQQLTEREETVYGVMCRVRGHVGQAGVVPTDLATLVAENAPGTTVEATAEPEATVEATAEATSEPEATVEATEESSSTPTLLSNNGDGYLFLVGGNGRFAILRSSGRSLTPLVDWRDSDKIAKGAARNHIRAVCVNDYLALYVNDVFLADAIDDRYASGQVGLAAAGATRLGITVNFDNLTVSEGRAG